VREETKVATTLILNTEDAFSSLKQIDWTKAFADTSAYAVTFEVSHAPIMGVTLTAGIFTIDGKGHSTLSLFKEWDMVYLQFKTTF